ncbi:MAG: SDR family NAD(P)-dependent oxidoreductase [Rhizobiales bacterium]|nr:SDR family NAD(P)-dependent oxidoreductase [Hyphomicrobiales bacterium]
MRRFTNKVAVVTGAGRGIGAVIAKDLIEEGATVYVPDLDAQRSEKMATNLGQSAKAGKLDVTKHTDVQAFFSRLEEEVGGVDYLVNCAGGYVPLIPSLSITEHEYDLVMDSNLKGTFLCCQSAVPQMIERNGGAIVNFSSLGWRSSSTSSPVRPKANASRDCSHLKIAHVSLAVFRLVALRLPMISHPLFFFFSPTMPATSPARRSTSTAARSPSELSAKTQSQQTKMRTS